ncbi:RhoGEF domain-containing protein [Balamuthia mandrillaris]
MQRRTNSPSTRARASLPSALPPLTYASHSPLSASTSSAPSVSFVPSTSAAYSSSSPSSSSSSSALESEDLFNSVVEICKAILVDATALVEELNRKGQVPGYILDAPALFERAKRTTKAALALVKIINAQQQKTNALGSAAVIGSHMTLRRSRTQSMNSLSSKLQASVAQLIRKTTDSIKASAPVSESELSHIMRVVTETIREVLQEAVKWRQLDEEQPKPAQPRDLNEQVQQIAGNCVSSVKALVQAATGMKGDVAFSQTARTTLNHLNALVEIAKEAGLQDDEYLLREVTYDLLAAAKARFEGMDSSGKDLDQTITNIVAAIRSLLIAVPEVVERKQKAVNPRASTILAQSQIEQQQQEDITGSDEEQRAKRERMRAASVKEMMDSETVYYTQLRTLMFSFVDPLVNGAHEVVNDKTISSLFDSLQRITQLTKEILTELKKVLETTGKVGEVFVKRAALLKMYSSFINTYDAASEKLTEARQKNSDLNETIQKFCSSNGVADISFYLILPIQRLPRYEMLISGILKYTAESHPDMENLQTAFEMVKGVNNHINEKKREQENREKIFAIQNSLILPAGKEDIQLYVKGRLFIREGAVDDSANQRKRTTNYYFMFNDILVKTELDKRKSRRASSPGSSASSGGYQGRVYQFVEILPFSGISLHDVHSEDELSNVFAISVDDETRRFLLEVQGKADKRKSKSLDPKKVEKERMKNWRFFHCISANEKQIWMKSIGDSINVNKLMAKTENGSAS